MSLLAPIAAERPCAGGVSLHVATGRSFSQPTDRQQSMPGEACRPRHGLALDDLEVHEPVIDRKETGGAALTSGAICVDLYTRLRIGASRSLGLPAPADRRRVPDLLPHAAVIASPLLRPGRHRTRDLERPATTRCAPRPRHATRSAWSSMPSTTCSTASASGRRSCRRSTPSSSTRSRSAAASKRERTAALERERDANRLKDEFLATLSHELRTPLNAVLGWTRVLRTAASTPATQARALESIERNARAQARLIEDLLEVSRIVTGKLRLQVQRRRPGGHRRRGRRSRAAGGGGQAAALTIRDRRRVRR